MDEILVQIAPEIDREIPPEILREIFKPNLTKEQETELIEKCLRLTSSHPETRTSSHTQKPI